MIPEGQASEKSGRKEFSRPVEFRAARTTTWHATPFVDRKNEVTEMKFLCFGFKDEANCADMSESERKSFMERCFSYDDELRRNGHFLGGEALQSSGKAATIRYQNGRVIVTDGPFAETKEQIGGILLLEARDRNHAIELMARHPGVRVGGFEIRAADEEINALIAARTADAASDSAS
jgi:hypothetical protein